MAIEMPSTLPNGATTIARVLGYPDTCPICHHASAPIFVGARRHSDKTDSDLDAAFQCPRAPCRYIFVGRYYQARPGSASPYLLKEVVPITVQGTTFSAEIKGVSPTFVTVFNQVEAADAAGLDQLVGMGLRKALEFLVKDFAVSRAGTDEEKEQIKRKLLARCIEDHVADAAVRVAAKRATWLGNDETHYIRRWEAQDISDLKKLVRLTVNAVENVLLSGHYERTMPEPR